MRCSECGAPATESDLFCGECGAILEDLIPSEPATEPAAELASYSPPPQPIASHDPRTNAAFVLGIVSVVLVTTSCLPFFAFSACFGGVISCLGPIAGIIATVLGSIVQRDIEARGGLEEDRKKARQGMIMGIVSIVIYVLIFVLGIVLGIGVGVLEEF